MNGRERIRGFLATVVAGLAIAAAIGAWSTAGTVLAAEQLALPDNPLQGRLVFESRRCNQCHGFSRSGTGPDLAGGHFGGGFLDLGAALWNHVPGMSVDHEMSGIAWPKLDRDEVVELIAFLYYIDYLGRPGRAERGRRLFDDKGCAACHTIGGQGNASGLDLGGLQRFASPLYIAQAIWNHGPSMLDRMHEMRIASPSFADGDLADLSAFIRQAGGDGPQERMLLSPGNPNRGRQVFQDKGCSRCHAEHGRGGRDGPDLSQADLHRSAEGIAGTMWNHALAMSEIMRQRGVEWPEFTTLELADLIAFVYFLPFDRAEGSAARGEEVFVSRSCAGCHASSDGTEHTGPDLVGDEAVGSPAALVAAMWNHAPIMKEAILGEGRPWPILSGEDLHDLLAYLRPRSDSP